MTGWTSRKAWAVIGAGHGGQALAAYMALQGERVRLYNRTPERLEGIRRQGGIALEGAVTGFARLERVSSDLAEVLDGASIVMVVVPASAHGELAEAIAPYLESGQVVILNPGRTLGAVEFAHRLRAAGGPPDVTVAETDTFVFASRWLESGRSRIHQVKRRVHLAALPATRTSEVLRLVRRTWPQFTAAASVLETGLSNIGAIFHPAPTLLNISRVESGPEFDHYHEGISPGVARALEALDAERLAVAASFSVPVLSARAWLKSVYGTVGETLHNAIHNTAAYLGLKAPTSLDHRYVFEEIPASLVPLAELARVAGGRAKTIESLITLAGAVTGIDWEARGRTLDAVGLGGMDAEDIHRYVTVGLRQKPRRPALRRRRALTFLETALDATDEKAVPAAETTAEPVLSAEEALS